MSKFSIDGKWVGQVSYGPSFPAEYKTKKLSFIIAITSQNGIIKGSCEDDTTKQLQLAPASIEGFYREDVIQFVKHYPCLVTVDDQNNLKAILTEPSIGVEYKGRRYWKLFSRKNYFKGTWEIVWSFKDKQGVTRPHRVGGTWEMESNH